MAKKKDMLSVTGLSVEEVSEILDLGKALNMPTRLKANPWG
jgi:hypothetical protein